MSSRPPPMFTREQVVLYRSPVVRVGGTRKTQWRVLDSRWERQENDHAWRYRLKPVRRSNSPHRQGEVWAWEDKITPKT